MPISPYESTDRTKETAMRTLRWANIGLFSLQPILGFLAANQKTFGISENGAAGLRTVHIFVGGAAATTYTINAGMQW
jgi:hypothetical protein